MDIINKLEQFIKAGEPVEIVYYGGSNPGKPRFIIPTKIVGEKLIARHIDSNEMRTFLISKIAFSDDKPSLESSFESFHKADLFNFDDLNSFLQKYKSKLENLGWYVTSEENLNIGLHYFFKNGKPRKTAEISINFTEFFEEMVYDVDKNNFILVKKKAIKPYTVRAPKEITRSFSYLNKALDLFMNYANKYSPKKKI
ncbi:MAG: hypothetical protein KatS3mg036_0194 [Ignavibacterium sp.]|nr:MAG: hypothetical protein KatS3mg036_0194 [Ignavibacterium sp.]